MMSDSPDGPAPDTARDSTPSVVAEAAAQGAPRKPPSAAAQRALAEAAERRARAQEEARAKEIGGRGGLEPARYGDWEIKGIACDF
jgi:hypothetical protein